ncbi:MAG: hypothetical protein HUU47_05230 [Bacteroidetes bacterium]|nr:hypothetical protein [Bacteroidota bacterium]
MNLGLKSILQLVLGLIFISIGIYVFVKKFETGGLVTNSNKYFFGGILCIYGVIKLIKIYLSDFRNKI